MYLDLEAELHDIFWDAEPEANEHPLLEAFLAQHPGKSLEVGCGSGRLLLPLLSQFDIEGAEISKDMVHLLEKNAASLNLSPTIHCGDILTLKLEQRYDAITIPAFTLQLLSRPQAHRLLEQLRTISKPHAGLYISTFIPWSEIVDDLEPDTWNLDKEAQLDDGCTANCTTRHQINRLHQTLDREHHYSVKKNGKTLRSHKVQQHLQYYFLPELQSLLEANGWSWKDYDADFISGHHDCDASIVTCYAQAN
ncbi:class I SAM-dependent methyltransferase [Rubritalea marina]|uniref:class I SAM-dependent methyltransferase n=1 Tax=Rubritalea marina TaxID=361055 RepID=UPI00035F4898|nr:class I SAM-dependent methyltransferase [Rubritalea marina]